MEIKKLTMAEELQILNLIDILNANYVDCGAARFLIKPIDNSNLDLYLKSIGLDNNSTPFIIKIAMGPGGLAQTQAEINTFLEYDNIRDYLADIYAYGNFIEVMEEVDTNFYDYNFFRRNGNEIDCDTFEDDLSDPEVYKFLIKNIKENYDLPEDEIKLLCLQGYDCFLSLQEIFGDTSDVGQIGTDLNHGGPKAYDYGFFYDIDCSSQTTDMDGEDYEGVYEYYIPELLSSIKDAIENNIDLDDEKKKDIVSYAEDNYFSMSDYCPDDEDSYDHDEEYYIVQSGTDDSIQEYFDYEEDAIEYARQHGGSNCYVTRIAYPADCNGNSLDEREEEEVWSYSTSNDTHHFEEKSYNTNDMTDTLFWED